MELRVVATAGHVDHGKSSLILRMTGMDPDRFEEEKRRGLTIDLGFAWLTLPSGREIGFVDVPGHERFIANMLAGVGPVRLVLFVVAADEGWKPQSEEHLQILDVLGVEAGVIALTKVDLVDDETRELALMETRERLQGSALEDAPVVPVSSVTGEGLGELTERIDQMVSEASVPEPGRMRLFIDRAFSIRGAGTVVTGTLTGDRVRVGDQVEVLPSRIRARVRGLQTHKRTEEWADPVARVAANLVGVDRADLARGGVMSAQGAWPSTSMFEAELRATRDLERPITARGAFKVYAGAAEVDAKIRFIEPARLEPGPEPALVRIRTSEPLVLDLFDRFVVREAGRNRTVAGGRVLDPRPPARAGARAADRLRARAGARSRTEILDLLVSERGAITREEAALLTGVEPVQREGYDDRDGWLVANDLSEAASAGLRDALEGSAEGDLGSVEARRIVEGAIRRTRPGLLRSLDGSRVTSLADALLSGSVDGSLISRTAGGRISAGSDRTQSLRPSFDGLLQAIGGESEAKPPTIPELVAAGHSHELLSAAERAGELIRVSPEIVVTPSLLERAERIVKAAGSEGITAGRFKEELGTTRRYAIPLLEWLDRRGLTRREGDRRFARGN